MEGLYGADPNPIAEQEWGYITSKEITKGKKLYLFVFDWPSKNGGLLVNQLDMVPKKIEVLETGELLQAQKVGEGLEISLSEFQPD